MATGGMTTVRNNLYYIGGTKQAAWNTPITTAPAYYHRWLDGSSTVNGAQHAAEREGDTSPYVTLIYKTGQYWGYKIVEYIRPRTIGNVFQAFFGTGSDTYTAPTKTTTTSGATNNAGSTTLVVVGDLGNVGLLAVNLEPGLTSANYEVALLDLTTRSGVGPYTYTLAAGGTLRLTHAAASAVTSQSLHKFVRQPTTYDPYTYEVGYGMAGVGTRNAYRLSDCVCTEVQISGQKGMPWKCESTWIAGKGTNLGATLQTPTFEGQTQTGLAGAPFMWYQGSQWQMDGGTSGNAASLVAFTVSAKNTTSWEEHVAETLTPSYFSMGNIDIAGSAQVIFQSFAQYHQFYFGSNAPAVNAVDSYLVGFSSFDLITGSDGVNTLEMNLPRVNWTGPQLDPNLDGKDLMQPLSFTASKPIPGASPVDALILTLGNSQNSQY